MNAGNLPLTTQRFGSRVCPGCEKPLDDGRTTVDTEAAEPVRNRYGGFSDCRTRQVIRRWHVDCLNEFEASNERLREQVRADQIATVREMGRAAGMSDAAIDALIEK
jgi:hypothetical protein